MIATARHVVFVGPTTLGILLAKRFEMNRFERQEQEQRLEKEPGFLGTFLRHNHEWKDRAPLVFERLQGVSGSLVIEGMLEQPKDVDMLAVALGDAMVTVVAMEETPLEEHLDGGGFFHRVECSGDQEADFQALLQILGNDANFGSFQDYDPPGDDGIWTNHPLEAITQPVPPIAAAIVVQRVLALADSRREYKQFCGTHPVSLDRDNYETLIEHPYAISPKVDGTRYFLLVVDSQLFFINRACDVWAGPKNPQLTSFNGSLLDCEITTESQRNHPTLMIIDVLAVHGRCQRKLHLRRRLDQSRSLIRFLQGQRAKTLFTVVYQRYIDLYRPEASALVRDCHPLNVDNTIDGFIFTPLRMPYIMGRCYHLMKWKPDEKNTVDLRFKAPDEVFCTNEEEEMIPVGTVSGVPDRVSTGCILECRKGDTSEEWVFDRLRPDKNTPNVQWVLDRIVKTMEDNITQNDILGWIDASTVYRNRDRGGPPQKRRQEPVRRRGVNRFAALNEQR